MLAALLTLTCLAELPGEPMLRADDAQHVIVSYAPGKFAGWPANHGMWNWGNEIVVGYSKGTFKDLGPTMHHIDRDQPEEFWLGRSLDGGLTWTEEHPTEKGYLIPRGDFLHGTETPGLALPPITELKEPMDFTHPDFALNFHMENIHAGLSRFEFTYDRGHTWHGPYALPDFGTLGTAARTDYIVNGKHDAHIVITVSKENGKEGRPLCARTTDGGVTWEHLGWIGPEPFGFAIMPSTLRISENELYTTLRCREGTFRWISAYRSLDNGKTWSPEINPVDYLGEGNPPMLNHLKDGRIVLTYGVRAYPFSIRARISEDHGKTWGPQIVLRDDAVDRDTGYVRSIVRPDGKVVTTYYMNNQATGPECFIGATIWDPTKLSPITSGEVHRQDGF